ncbi:MAG: arylsulfatase A-like enzyme [Myxococcota bacterium]|jgi:arylsulfatase A-like enzyme
MLALLLSCTTPEPAALVEPPAATPRADLPNIVLVSMDTLRADRLGSAGYRRDTTPFLDTQAAAGMQFRQAYAQAPSTLITHTSMFTSLLPQEHQVMGHNRKLEDRRLTLAEHLSAQGYATYMSFTSLRFMPEIGINQGFETVEPFWNRPKNQRGSKVTDSFHAYAAQAADRPVFAFLHYFDAHAPYNPPEPFLTRYHEARPDLIEPREIIAYLDANRFTPIPIEELNYLEALYDGGVAFLDAELRRLHEGTVIGNGRPTIWIFTADHGEEFKEQGYLGHSTWMHEELLRVPLIVTGPGVVTGQTDAIAQSVDLFPTLLDLLKLPHPDGLQGRSLAPALTGSESALAQPWPGVSDVVPFYENPRNWAVAATIDGQRFKLVKQEDVEYALHRVDVDPGRDVMVKHQPQAATMLALAESLQMPTKHQKLRRSGIRDANLDELEMLRAMGYVDEIEAAERSE